MNGERNKVSFSINNSNFFTSSPVGKVGIAQTVQWLCYGLDNQRIGVRVPAEAIDFSSFESCRTSRAAHPASYSEPTGRYCTEIKAPRV